MKKAKKLNLYQMWELYRFNQKDLAKSVPRSLKMLYPDTHFQDMETDEKIAWYFRGLDRNLYFHLQGFIGNLKSHGR